MPLGRNWAQKIEWDDDDLPMSDRRAHFFGNVERGQQGPLLVAQGAGATLLEGERDEHL
jgi:hypothetical protein